MRFIDFLNENTNSKSRTDKWTLDQIKNAEYSDSFMNDREEVCIKGKSYVKIGKNEWQYFSTNPHVIGSAYTDNEIYKMMHESVKNDDKIVFHDYEELKEYCDDPNNPLDRVVLGKEITSLRDLFYKSSRTNEQFDGISEWDVSNVKNMAYMFCKAASFNQPLNNWDVSNVEDVESMFDGSKLEKTNNLPDWYTKWYSSQYNESYEGVLENKFLGKKLTFIDQYSGEDLFVGLITAGEYGMYVTVIKSFDSHIKKGDDYGLNIESDYIRVVDGKEEIAIWSEDWDRKYHRSLDEDDIKDSILKRMKKMFHGVKTDIYVNDNGTYFSVKFTVYDNYEANAYGGMPSWKKWFKEDLGIDPKSVEGSKTRHLGSAGGFDYAMRINK